MTQRVSPLAGAHRWVDVAFAAKRSFGGIAIHHLDTWMKLEGIRP